jgi:hypothetical protein
MKNKNAGTKQLSPSELQLIQQLREHPEMLERVQSILAITHNTDGPLKTADEVEELLIQEMRQLGNTSMQHWAIQAEERVGQELKSQHPDVRSRKKKR